MPKPTIGQQIKKQRAKAGLSLQEAANRAGMSISQWWRIESGGVPNPGINTIEKMTKAMGVK
ncbi:MAG: helix-turn-helix domain-containing protein [Phycisphaerae bacterium]|nr:helix-turn-helix domain-containing protein [Phycisphaerae bacterium]